MTPGLGMAPQDHKSLSLRTTGLATYGPTGGSHFLPSALEQTRQRCRSLFTPPHPPRGFAHRNPLTSPGFRHSPNRRLKSRMIPTEKKPAAKCGRVSLLRLPEGLGGTAPTAAIPKSCASFFSLDALRLGGRYTESTPPSLVGLGKQDCSGRDGH